MMIRVIKAEAINLANKIIEEEDVFAVVGSFLDHPFPWRQLRYTRRLPCRWSPRIRLIRTSRGWGYADSRLADCGYRERTATAKMLYDQFDGKDLAILRRIQTLA